MEHSCCLILILKYCVVISNNRSHATIGWEKKNIPKHSRKFESFLTCRIGNVRHLRYATWIKSIPISWINFSYVSIELNIASNHILRYNPTIISFELLFHCLNTIILSCHNKLCPKFYWKAITNRRITHCLKNLDCCIPTYDHDIYFFFSSVCWKSRYKFCWKSNKIRYENGSCIKYRMNHSVVGETVWISLDIPF